MEWSAGVAEVRERVVIFFSSVMMNGERAAVVEMKRRGVDFNYI